MKCIFGLGNPGKEYVLTRHNVGFMVLDELARKVVDRSECELVKPQTFMNESGVSIAHTLRKHQVTDYHQVYVVHDDLDIVLGEYKIQFGRGPHDHNGLLSIYQHLNSKQWYKYHSIN